MRMMMLVLSVLATGAVLWAGAEEKGPSPGNWNVPVKTMGGKQFWGDVTLYGGWRIQRNVFTGHFRLLDARDVRRAWGGFDACRHALDDAIASGSAQLSSPKLVLLVHGFLRSKDSFAGLDAALKEAGYEVYSVNYPSSGFDVDVFARQIQGLLDQATADFEEVSLVTHSMGGLVARRALSQDETPEVHGLVMIAPPNQGAVMADLLLDWWPSEHITGPAGKQLTTKVEGFAKNAGAPKCSFGVIAGARGTEDGWNPLIPGDDDGVVGVESTRMEGMADFAVVEATHTVIMNDASTVKHVIRFLQEGSFLPAAPPGR